MPPILAFEKVSKRFGAVVVAQEIDLALAEGEALGIIGPNGAGKTTLFGIASGTVQPDAGRVVLAGVDITRLAPERRCRMGIGRSFQIPQPFNGMTVFENLVVAAAFGGGHGEREVYPRCVELLEQCALADKANRPAGTLTLLDRKRLELARALATRAARAAARRGRGRPDRARMPRAGRADPRHPARSACRSSGSSTSCMRWSPSSTGWWCCTAAVSSARAIRRP